MFVHQNDICDEGDFWTKNDHLDPSVMVMKNRKDLCEDLKYVISVPEFCDVTFLMGPEQRPVYGIKAILATRSRVMYQTILSTENNLRLTRNNKKSVFKRKFEKLRSYISKSEAFDRYSRGDRVGNRLCIEIKEYDERVFERLMRYIHCGVVAVDAETVIGLMNAARQFEFPELREACWDFALQCVRPDKLSTLVETAIPYSQYKDTRQLMQEVMDFLGDTPDVLHCCPEIRNLIPIQQGEHMC